MKNYKRIWEVRRNWHIDNGRIGHAMVCHNRMMRQILSDSPDGYCVNGRLYSVDEIQKARRG